MQKVYVQIIHVSIMSFWYAGMIGAIFECELSENGFAILPSSWKGSDLNGRIINFKDGLIIVGGLTQHAADGLTAAQKEEVSQMIQSALDTGSA